MKKIFTVAIIALSANAYAQIPEDAIRYSWLPNNGTARMMAIGGAMGSLGGEISSAYINPAGIGFYKNDEIVLTPNYKLGKSKTTFRDFLTNTSKNSFGFGTSGVVLGNIGNTYKRTGENLAAAIVINQTADFNNLISYKGLNNYSSYSEAFVEEFLNYARANNGDISGVLNTQSAVAYGAAPAFYTYLIDTLRVNGQMVVKGAPEYLLDAGKALMQENTKTTSGGIYELALAAGASKDDKLFIGGSIGLPIVNYHSNTVFKESDTSASTSNGFGSFTYTDDFSTQGLGINGKLGIIYRPQDYIRLGLAVHSPSYLWLTDTRTTTLNTVLEPAVSSPNVSSQLFTNNQPGESQYRQSNGWKVLGSAAYVFREIKDVTKQKGFITADIEYQMHGTSRFKSKNEEPTADEKAYYNELNQVVKDEYKGAFNFRVGGELKFTTVMARLGFAHYGNPYKDNMLKAARNIASAGLGYRNKGFFVDVTYAYQMNKNVDFAYRLASRANTFATIKENRGNVVATLGWKF